MKIIIAALAIISIVFLLGCTGSPPTSNINNPPPAADAFDDYSRIANAAKGMDYQVSYEISSTLPTYGSQSGTSTIYKKGNDMRIDMKVSGNEVRGYIIGDNTYTCTIMGEWKCYKMEATEEQKKGMRSEVMIELDKTKQQVTSEGTMDVAGASAKCFRVADKQSPTQTFKLCLSQEGIMLYMQGNSATQGASMTVEYKATSFSKTVSSTDFELPASPEEFNANQLGNYGPNPDVGYN